MRRMRFIASTMIVMAIVVGLRAGDEQTSPTTPAQARTPVFVAIYERGPAWDSTKDALQQPGIGEHMQFLRGNAEKLVAAAPFQQGLAAGASDRTVGMIIVLAAAQDEAETMLAGDPAIAGKLMTATVRRWLVERVRAY